MAYKLPSLSLQEKWIILAARLGLTAIGVVYSLVGILTFAAAFGIGGSSKGNVSQILEWIQDQPLGQFLLGLTALGLLCYTVWRFVEAIKDTENKGTSLRGLSIRVSYLSYGVVYAVLTWYAARLLVGKSSEVQNTRQTVAQMLLEQPLGQWMVGAIALGTAGTGLFQIYLALSNEYKQIFEKSVTDTRIKKLLIKSGKIGYVARGIVWLIIAYFMLEVAIQSDSSEAGDSNAALYFMKREYGPITLAIVSLGLLCYGIFMFVRARYQPIINR